MNTELLLVAGAVAAVALVAFIVIRKPARQSAVPDTSPARRTSTAPAQRPASVPRTAAEVEKSRKGAMLMPGPDCCWGVRQLVDNWFPEGEIPELPLDACDRIANCKCHYRHLPDRRTRPRRTQTDRRTDIRFETRDDRRCGEDRRNNEDRWKISV